MKKLFVISLSIFSLCVNAQSVNKVAEDYYVADTAVKAPSNWNTYVAGSISISTGNDLKMSSYPSVEIGRCYKNLAFGLNAGRTNLVKNPLGEKIENYYYEIKTMASFPIGAVKGYAVIGFGQYKPTHSFIEYGGGIVYSINKVDLMMQVSNWDGTTYVSPGIAYNF